MENQDGPNLKKKELLDHQGGEEAHDAAKVSLPKAKISKSDEGPSQPHIHNTGSPSKFRSSAIVSLAVKFEAVMLTMESLLGNNSSIVIKQSGSGIRS